MPSRTLVAAAAAALTVIVSTTGFALWQNAQRGPDPARWPVVALPPSTTTLPHSLHVAPADCPGFSLSSPVPADPRNVPGSGSYTVRLGGSHYALWVCLGTVSETSGARASIADRLGVDDSVEGMELRNTNPTLVQAPYGELVRVDRSFGPTQQPRLTDWLVDHDGYTYGFGYLHPVEDASRFADVEAMIATVVWDGP